MKYNHLFSIKNIFFLALICAFGSCTDDNALAEPNYQLTWEDNFDGEAGTLPDATKWKFDVGTGWGNNQLEYDTDRAENVSMDGEGNLAIVAREESFGGQPFTSGRISTQNLFAQAYGRFEARIKMPYGPGIWPAFWLLGEDVEVNTWPQCGEIDIMENRGQLPHFVYGSVHGPGYSAGNAVSKSYGLENNRFDSEFHVFRVDWGEDYINYFVDDVFYFQVTPKSTPGDWVYDHPFFIILNVAVGGDFVGFPTNQTDFPQTMLVDYVKVYQEVK